MRHYAILLNSGSEDTFPCTPKSDDAALALGYERLKESAAFLPPDARRSVLPGIHRKLPFACALACHLAAVLPPSASHLTVIDWGSLSDDLTVSLLNRFDVLFMVHGDASDHFLCGTRSTCPDDRRRIERVLARTTACVVTPPSFQRFLLHKFRYYGALQRAGIPVAPFFHVDPAKVRTQRDAEEVLRRAANKRGWKGAIVKPSYGAYSQGITVYRDVARTSPATVLRDMRVLADKEYPPVTVQRFIPSFGKQYEVRTYWVNEAYMYSVATWTPNVETGGKGGMLWMEKKTSFRKEGGTLDDALLVKLKKLAGLVFRCLPRYGDGKFPFLRIDFACCLRDDGSCFAYFVNEVETFWCNMLLSDQKDISDDGGAMATRFAAKLAKSLIAFAKAHPEGGVRKLQVPKLRVHDEVRAITGCTGKRGRKG